jgi:uracil-DNA glycosylase family 4
VPVAILCPLRGRPVVPPTPALAKLRLVIVGEGPGRNEEKLGAPFVGLSGKLLDTQLREHQVPRGACHITNAALCRGETDKENDIAAACCAPRLLRELAALPASVPIVTLGKSATVSVLGYKKILYARGFIWEAPEIAPDALKLAAREVYKAPVEKREVKVLRAETLRARAKLTGRTVLPTIHPAFVLRADTWHPVFRLDMRRACKLANGERLPREEFGPTPHYTGGPTLLQMLGPDVSCDIETDGIIPLETGILCIGFSDGTNTVVIWPWRPSYAKRVSRFLRTRRAVVFHNGYNFDQIVMGAHGIDFRGVALEDTLLAHHAYASHLPQRLDHVVSEYCNAAPWKIRFGRRGKEEKGLPPVDMPPTELCLYNAADARLTILAWQRMQGDLAKERAVYEHDKELAAICRDMGRIGIGVDHVRREALSNKLVKRCAALKGRMRKVAKWATFNPRQTVHVRKMLFGRFKARRIGVTPTGLAATNNVTLEALKLESNRAGRFAALLLKWRVADKVRGTYIDSVHICNSTGRAHYNWKPFGTVSGRLSCRLQSAPRDEGTGAPEELVREIYVPRSAEHEFVYFDVSQAEMRLAAYLSGDETFIRACDGDVHANNAKNVFPDVAAKGWLDGDAKKDPARGKPYRDIAKNLGFAISYLAEAEKVFITLRSKGFPVTFAQVVRILASLHSKYHRYYRFVEENIAFCKRHGHLRGLCGRIRWFGWYPKPTEIANYPIQEALAAIMNARCIALAARLPRGVELVAQIHDACIFDVPKQLSGKVENLIREEWAKPIPTPGGALVLPIDLKRGRRWSEL